MLCLNWWKLWELEKIYLYISGLSSCLNQTGQINNMFQWMPSLSLVALLKYLNEISLFI